MISASFALGPYVPKAKTTGVYFRLYYEKHYKNLPGDGLINPDLGRRNGQRNVCVVSIELPEDY